jgi:hypothetical protein
MKRIIALSLVIVTFFVLTAAAQAPAGGQGPAGQGRGAGGGGGRGGRGGAPAPPATGPIADRVNEIVAAVNKPDAAALQKVVTMDALWADEDGHILPANIWKNKITTGATPKKLTISNLRVGNTDDAGWAAFNYVLDEGANMIRGTNTMVFKKVGADWQVVLVHGAINTNVGAH